MRLANSLKPPAGFIVIRIVPVILVRRTTGSIAFCVGIVSFPIVSWRGPLQLVQEALGSIAVSDGHLRFDSLLVYHFDPDIELLVPF
mmetsp:Transcript_14163/g.29307  ORF Transcript_14163/g.29307 Transcript_14163/m.29307 type:complete len:87 (+) Transcript_14163:786-1046(+)